MKLIRTETYWNSYEILDNFVKRLIDSQIKILVSTKGYGKSLYKNILFERKVGVYRLLYIRKENNELILILLLIVKKKSQQDGIDFIKKNLDKFI